MLGKIRRGYRNRPVRLTSAPNSSSVPTMLRCPSLAATLSSGAPVMTSVRALTSAPAASTSRLTCSGFTHVHAHKLSCCVFVFVLTLTFGVKAFLEHVSAAVRLAEQFAIHNNCMFFAEKLAWRETVLKMCACGLK